MANLREIEELEDLGIILSDGCRLSARHRAKPRANSAAWSTFAHEKPRDVCVLRKMP